MGSRLATQGTGASVRRRASKWRPTAAGLGLAVLVAISACGDRPPRAQGPHRDSTSDDADAGDANPHGASATDAIDAGADAALTEAECRGLVDHVVEIAMRRFREQSAAQGKPIPTEAQLQEIRGRLQRELGTACLAMPRPVYECAVRARDAAALEACEGERSPVEN